MTKREKKNALLSEKTNVNASENRSILTVASTLRATRCGVGLILALVGASLWGTATGCAGGRKCFLSREKNIEAVDPLAQTETALCVDGRVAHMEIAKNSKRILVELRDDACSDAYSEFFASGGRRTPSGAAVETPCVELWNVEFLEARREAFDATQGDGVGAAAFDESGTRVFWTTREIDRSGRFAASSEGGARAFQNATSAGFSGFATTSGKNGGISEGVDDDSARRNKIAQVAATTTGRAGDSAATAFFRSRPIERRNVWRPAARTVLATRAFERSSAPASQEETASSATRLKISEEAKSAEAVWLSPNARWIVGRVPTNALNSGLETVEAAEDAGTGEVAQDGAIETTGEWALTLRRDRRRVARFPQTVKMTFAELTSNETVEGRVVDVLAVSPAGDLVATLVEETPPRLGETAEREIGEIGQVARLANVSANKGTGEYWAFEEEKEAGKEREVGEEGGEREEEQESEDVGENEEYVDFAVDEESENADFNGRADFIPRFKIVVWDLSVAETVDWEKAKKPLQALEVAQIAVSGPVSRRFCRFSPNGQIFAARIDPRYISLWQAANGRLLVELGEHRDDVSDFAFSPNGMKVAAATGAGARVVLWNVRKGAAHRALDETAPGVEEIDAVAFSPDGGSVYFANNLGEIKRWNARAERRVAPSDDKL